MFPANPGDGLVLTHGVGGKPPVTASPPAVPGSDGVRLASVLHLYTIPPVLLCPIQRNIGAAEEGGEFFIGVPLGQANTDSNPQLHGGNRDRFVAYVLPHPFGHFPRCFGGAVGQHHEELLAPASAPTWSYSRTALDTFFATLRSTLSPTEWP